MGNIAKQGAPCLTPRVRLAFCVDHPIQYQIPLYRQLAKKVDLTVFYRSLAGAESFDDPEFGVTIQWDIDMLGGYRHEIVLPHHLLSRLRHFDAIVIHGYSGALERCAFLGAWLWRKRVFLRAEVTRPTRALRWLTRHVTGVMAIGALSRQVYQAMGVPDTKIFWTPYAIDVKRFQQGVRTTSFFPVVLFAGKLIPKKNPIDLLNASWLVTQPHTLMFIGDGELRPQLVGDNVVCLGFINQKKMPSMYHAADLLVLPSSSEPYGLVVTEACAAGLPVIVSDACGVAHDLVDDNGFTYQAGNVGQLAECLGTLLADPALRQRMGARSKEIVQGFTIDRAVAGILQALASE